MKDALDETLLLSDGLIFHYYRDLSGYTNDRKG